MANIAQQLADFACGTSFDCLPDEVVVETKRILLDSIGCAVAGVAIDKGWIAVAAARKMNTQGNCILPGVGDRVGKLAAAFVWGELINALDYDICTTPPGHVIPYVLPAALVLAEERGASGEELIRAIAVANEVSCRLGMALSYYRDIRDGKLASHDIMGYSSTVIGGELAACLIGKVPPTVVPRALGLAGYMVPVQTLRKWVSMSMPAMSKYLMGGWMAQTELMALALAEENYRSDTDIFEGEFGFWRFIGSTKWNPTLLLSDLGSKWRFPACTNYKVYPCCRIMHTALDCFTNMIETNGLKPDEIDHVEAFLEPNCMDKVWENTTIESPVDAQFSVAYNFAVAAHRVKPGPVWQAQEIMGNGEILSFMKKVHFGPHPDFARILMEDPASRPEAVEITARGTTFREERRYARGTPTMKSTRLTDKELVCKFRDCTLGVLGEDSVQKLADQLLRLETVTNIAGLMEELRPAKGKRTK